LPETQERFRGLGAAPLCAGRAALEKTIAEDSERWAQVVRRGGIKLE